jgi:cytidyltransferase-like protein
MQKIIIVSGYFNPIHKGHLEYFINAKAQGDLLFVTVNSDHQSALKGSKEFQKEDERLFILQHIKEVDQAFLSIDQDRAVCKTLEYLHQ